MEWFLKFMFTFLFLKKIVKFKSFENRLNCM
jgi:hypothetical protein